MEEKADPVTTAVLKGNKGSIIDEVKKAIADGAKPEEIINDQLIAAINKVGEFLNRKIFPAAADCQCKYHETCH